MRVLVLAVFVLLAAGAIAQTAVDNARNSATDASVVSRQEVAPNSGLAVKQADSSTNTASTAVVNDPRVPNESAPKPKATAATPVIKQTDKDGSPSEHNTVGKALEKHIDDPVAQQARGNSVAADDVEDIAGVEATDEQVEPQEEGGEEGEEYVDEDEQNGKDGGGEEGDEEEEEGSEERENRPKVIAATESDEEEYDDDILPHSDGVDAKDIDVAGLLKVTPEELAAATEVGPHFNGEGNVDVKNLNQDKDTVDTLNKDLLSKVVNEGISDDDDKEEEKPNPDAANSNANGELAIIRRVGNRANPRPTPAVRRELALLKKKNGKLPTAARRPYRASSHPDLALSFNWLGSFDGKNFIKVPHSESFNSPSFTLTFYLTVVGNDTASWRNILHKGFTNFQRTPSLWLEYGSNRLYAAVSTSASSDESLTSKTNLIRNVPYHIAYVVNGRKLQIWVNGELDAEKQLLGDPQVNSGPLYIGKDPFYAGAQVKLTGFTWVQRPLNQQGIRMDSLADRQPSLVAFDRVGSFDGGSLSSFSIPHQDSMNTNEFSVCFWTTLKHHSSGRSRSIIHKGFQPEDKTPFIEVDEQYSRLNVRVSTDVDPAEGFYTKTVLRPGQPTHICYVRRDRELSLYIDGRLDTQMSTRGKTVTNEGPIFIGGSPFANGYQGDITGWRWFNKGFMESEVQTVLRATSEAPFSIRLSNTFTDKDRLRIPHNPRVMETPDFTISFYIRPTQGPNGKWRSILHKGKNARDTTPSIWLNPKTNQVTAEVTTTYALRTKARVTSTAELPLNDVSHVALTLKDDLLCLVIEGWVDGCTKIQGRVKHNKGVLFVGRSLRYAGFTGDISEIRYYSRALQREEVSPYQMDIPEPVFSYWNPALGDHVLSLNKRTYGEGLLGYQLISANEEVGDHGHGKGTPIGFAHSIEKGGKTVPLYAHFNDRDGDHWYTTDPSAFKAGYTLQGPVMYVLPKSTKQSPAVVPIFEHYNTKLGDSFFTPDPAPLHGYTSRGIAFFLEKDGTNAEPVVQYYNPPTDGGSTLQINTPMKFNGWNKFSSSDLGFLSPSKDFSVSFWLKLRSSGSGFYRTIVHHGSFPEERAPAIYLMPHETRLAVRMSTNVNFNEGMDSRTVIPLNQFTHVALVVHGNVLRLFINGELDMHHKFTGDKSFNPGGMHVGRFPDAPGVDGDVADFQFFDHVLQSQDVQQLMTGAIHGAEISFASVVPLGTGAQIQNSLVMQSEAFTILFDLYMLEGFTGTDRALIWKGNNRDESSPSVVLMGDENRIRVRLSTASGKDSNTGDFFIVSNRVLKLKQRYHVMIIRDGDTLSLYINYKLDKTVTTAGAVLFNNGPLYIGKNPWSGNAQGAISTFKWFSRPLSLREVLQFNDKVNRLAISKFDWRGRLSLGKHNVLPDTGDFDVTTDFSVSFWLKTEYDEGKRWRQIFLKGEQHFYKSPQISWFPSSGRLRVMVHLKDNVGEFEKMDSISTVPFYTPTHVALIRAGPQLTLYINGIAEAQMDAADMINTTGKGLFLGNLNAHVFNFRWQARAMMENEILEDVYSVRR